MFLSKLILDKFLWKLLNTNLYEINVVQAEGICILWNIHLKGVGNQSDKLKYVSNMQFWRK